MRLVMALVLATTCAPLRASGPQERTSGPDVRCEASREPHVRAYALPERARFDAWVVGHADAYAAFEAMLRAEELHEVVAPWTLWYQGTEWRAGAYPPFAEPPRATWTSIVPTLRLLRDEVMPVVGALCVVSGYRTRAYNASHGGKPHSKHIGFFGVDVLPARAWERSPLHAALARVHARVGPSRRMGLGLYAGVRFHVDTWGFRSW
jgi:hypothetical protein